MNNNSVLVSYNFDQNLAKFKKYYAFEKKRELNKIPSMGFASTVLLLIVSGLYFQIYILVWLGFITAGIVISFVVLFHIRYQMVIEKSSKELKTNEKIYTADMDYQFEFNSEKIVYKSKNNIRESTWKILQYYSENEDDIYLFGLKGELFDIYSESVMGKELFEKFKSIAKEKLKERK